MSFGDQWAVATVNDSDRTDPPEPGTYETALTDARAFTAKTSGVDWFVIELRVLAGPQQDHTWSVLANLNKEGGVVAAKSMSAKLGVAIDDVHSLDDLDRLVKVHIGNYYSVDVVQNGEWRNTFIRERIAGATMPLSDVPSDVPVPAGNAHPGPVDEEDIPFAPSIV
jgi:hypothetical protein